jgi:hypothetical protein
MFCVSKDLFLLREQNVSKLRCIVMSRMMFLHQKAIVVVLLSACLFRMASVRIHCLLCYVRVSVCSCNYTRGSVESLLIETIAREGFVKILLLNFQFHW